jgi:hypothetical protein
VNRLNHPDPSRLARLFSLNDDDAPSWYEHELAGIWRHQLAAPLAVDLLETEDECATTIARLSTISPAPLHTFGDLLTHPWPPLKLLRLVKEFAKVRRTKKHGAYPPEVATALYYAVIGLAISRHGTQITQLGGDDLRRGFEWAMELPWLDEPTRQIYSRALGTLSTP